MLKRIFASALIVLFIVVSYNKVSNWHIHIVNGQAVKHAHANSDDSQQKHTHNTSEIAFLSILDGQFSDDIQTQFLPQVFEKELNTSYVLNTKTIELKLRAFSNKSPPLA